MPDCIPELAIIGLLYALKRGLRARQNWLEDLLTSARRTLEVGTVRMEAVR